MTDQSLSILIAYTNKNAILACYFEKLTYNFVKLVYYRQR